MLKINMHNPHGVGSFVLVDPGDAIELQLDDVDAIEYESTLTFLQARSEFVLKFSPVFKGKGGESGTLDESELLAVAQAAALFDPVQIFELNK